MINVRNQDYQCYLFDHIINSDAESSCWLIQLEINSYVDKVHEIMFDLKIC